LDEMVADRVWRLTIMGDGIRYGNKAEQATD
jgi:hypothetical protein